MRMKWTQAFVWAVLAAGIDAASVASASDGIVEISHARALTGSINGSAALDPAGYPVVITVSGSYALTGDLTPPPDTTAIAINTPNVTIDLNGFAIRGENSCAAAGLNVSCTAVDRGRGVSATNCDPGIRVHDGRVVSMGDRGLNLCGNQSRIERVDASQNAGDGLRVGNGGLVVGCTARLNGGNGIRAGDGGIVRDSVVEHNGSNGIHVSGNAVIAGNVAYQNE